MSIIHAERTLRAVRIIRACVDESAQQVLPEHLEGKVSQSAWESMARAIADEVAGRLSSTSDFLSVLEEGDLSKNDCPNFTGFADVLIVLADDPRWGPGQATQLRHLAQHLRSTKNQLRL